MDGHFKQLVRKITLKLTQHVGVFPSYMTSPTYIWFQFKNRKIPIRPLKCSAQIHVFSKLQLFVLISFDIATHTNAHNNVMKLLSRRECFLIKKCNRQLNYRTFTNRAGLTVCHKVEMEVIYDQFSLDSDNYNNNNNIWIYPTCLISQSQFDANSIKIQTQKINNSIDFIIKPQ